MTYGYSYNGSYGGVSYSGSYEYGYGGAQGGGGCEDVFCEEDPAGRLYDERWVHVGRGRGEYDQVSSMQHVGQGRGEFTKEKYVARPGGMRCRIFCIVSLCLMLLLVIGLLIYYVSLRGQWHDSPCWNYATVMSQGMSAMCCQQGYASFCLAASPPVATPAPEKTVIHEQHITKVVDVPVPHVVPVPLPPPPRKVINHKVYVHSHAYDCEKGSNDWKNLWSGSHQRYCCYLKDIACSKKIEVHNHYHTITKVKPVAMPVRIAVPAPPPKVVTHFVNDPIHDPPQVIKVPEPGPAHVVPKYVHQKVYKPVPVQSPPQYHTVPVPVPVHDPGRVIPLKVQMPPKTVVRHKVIYKTKHVQVKHIYDCAAGFDNWNFGWSSAKKTWCCSHEERGCPGTWTGAGKTKAFTTHVTQHLGHQTYITHEDYHGDGDYVHHYDTDGHSASGYTHYAPGVMHVIHHYHHVGYGDGISGTSYHGVGGVVHHVAGEVWHADGTRHLDDQKTETDDK